MWTVGVDPGLNGGIVALARDNKVKSLAMPTVELQRADKKKRREICLRTIREFMIEIRADFIESVWVELVHSMPGQGVASSFSFGLQYGMIRGLCYAYSQNLNLVRPQAWKDEILADRYVHDKHGAIAYCKDNHKKLDLIPKGKRVPHDGLADAACIASYGYKRRKHK